jgi:hypothetical protein
VDDDTGTPTRSDDARATAAGPPPTTPARPGRSGEPWEAAEDARLVDGLRQGLDVTQLATDHGRTKGAITTRLARMVAEDDPDAPTSRTARVEHLRGLLDADPDYDWRSPLAAALAPQQLWSEDDDDALRVAWQDAEPLPLLAIRYGVGELVLARRLIALRLADGIVEVTDRLGCTPGGAADVRRALATDAAATAVAVLVVVTEGTVAHVSAHPDLQSAASARDALCARLLTDGRTQAEWTVAVRQVDVDPDASERGSTETGIVRASLVAGPDIQNAQVVLRPAAGVAGDTAEHAAELTGGT